MPEITPEISQSLRRVSFWAAILVVGLHALAEASAFPLKVLCALASAAVPMFFTLSGFFLARHWHEKGFWRREVCKRIRSLLVPYFIWLLLAMVLFGFLAPLLKWMVGTSDVFRPDWTYAEALGRSVYDWPFIRSFWFLRTLFILVVLSPIWLAVCLAGWRWLLPVALGVVLAGWYIQDYQPTWSPALMLVGKIGVRLRALLFVMLGAIIFRLDALAWLMRWGHGLGMGVAYLGGAVVLGSGLCLPQLGAFFLHGGVEFAGIVVLLALCSKIPLPSWLAQTSLALYLTHGIVLRVFREFIFWRGTAGHEVLMWCVCVLLGVCAWSLIVRGPSWGVMLLLGGRGRKTNRTMARPRAA